MYNSFYQFWHPGVAPWKKKGHLIKIKHGFFFEDKSQPFLLKEADTQKAIKDSLDFSISFSFNSQACVFKRSLYNKIKEGDVFYKSPYPDFYIANVALYMSASTAVIPKPIAIAGVSKASVGYTIYNDQDLIGEAILNNDVHSDSIYQSCRHQILTGPAYNTNYFIAMKYVENKLGKDEYKFNVKKYRKVQFYEAYSNILSGKNVNKWWPKMRLQRSAYERVWCYLMYKLRDPHFYNFKGKNKLLNLIEKKISISGNDPIVKKVGLFNTSKVSNIFKYLNEKK